MSTLSLWVRAAAAAAALALFAASIIVNAVIAAVAVLRPSPAIGLAFLVLTAINIGIAIDAQGGE